MRIRQEILKEGFELIECWEHKSTGRLPVEFSEKKTETFPHAIVFDFEAVLDTSKRRQPIRDLLFENQHIPVSVSLADTLNREPVHISSKDSEELIRRLSFLFYFNFRGLFCKSLISEIDILNKDYYYYYYYLGVGAPGAATIRRQMEEYIPNDFEFLPAKQQTVMQQWCFQIPVLGFISGGYDLNLIKKHFVTKITEENEVK